MDSIIQMEFFEIDIAKKTPLKKPTKNRI